MRKSQLVKGLQRVHREEGNPESVTSGKQSSRLQSQKSSSFQGREMLMSKNLQDNIRASQQLEQESVSELRVLETLDPQTDKILVSTKTLQIYEQKNNLSVHRQSQIKQFNSIVINNASSEMRFEEGGSIASDPHLGSIAMSTLNTEVYKELRARKSVHNEQAPVESLRTSKKKERDAANITSTRIQERKPSIQSMRSIQGQTERHGRERKSRLASKKDSQAPQEDLEDTQKNLSPSINSLNIKARKTEILNQNSNFNDLAQPQVLSQNVSPSKKIPVSNIFTPEQLNSREKQSLSARAFNSFSKTMMQSARNKELDDFKDSEEDRLRQQPQEMLKGVKSPFKNQHRDRNQISLLINENASPSQMSARAVEMKNIQRSPQMLMNKRGSKFGNLFKLQKKQINDEGIAHVDEGLNYSYEKQQKQLQLKTYDNDPIPDTPEDSVSQKSSGDSDFLKLEYEALKETYEQMNKQASARNKSNSPSGYNSMIKSVFKQSTLKQNETVVNQVDEQRDSQRQQKQRKNESSKQLESKRSPQGLKSIKNKGFSTNQTNSPMYTTMMRQKQKQLISYDENSFERELIEKLNEESSIHEDSDILSNKFNKSYKSNKTHKSHKSHKSRYGRQSQKNLKNPKKGGGHMSKKSMKIEQKSYASSDSCSTCNNRESRNSSLISEEDANQGKKRASSKHRVAQNKSKISIKKKSKGKRNTKNSQMYQNSPIAMPMMQPGMGVINPQQMAMLGFPPGGIMGNTTQIMNFQNNYSFQGGQMPYFVQQQQYYNMLFQQLQAQQKMFESQQFMQQQTHLSPQNNQAFLQDQLFQAGQTNPSVGGSNNFQGFNQTIPDDSINPNLIPPFVANKPANTLQTPVLQKVQSQSPRQNSNQRSLDSTSQFAQPKNNFSNHSLDLSEQDLVTKHGFTFAKQKSAQEKSPEANKRLGSPQSNFSRLEMQSTTITGDFLGPSVFPSTLPSEAGLVNRKTVGNHENIQNQVKEANQQYLNKLKDKFQAAALAAHSTITNLFSTEISPQSQSRDISVPKVWGPALQESKYNSNFNNFNSQKLRDSQARNQSSTLIPQMGLSRFSPQRDQIPQVYPQSQTILMLDEKHSIVNSQLVNKRLSSLPQKQEFALQNRLRESRQSDEVMFERQRSPQQRESQVMDEKKSLEIQTKLRMLNQKLVQGQNTQISTEPNDLNYRKYSNIDSMPLSPQGDARVDLPYLDNSSQHNMRYTETETSRAKQKKAELFEMNSDKGDKYNKNDFSIVQQRVISIPFARRKIEQKLSSEERSQDAEQYLIDNKSVSIPITKRIQQAKNIVHQMSSPRRSIQQTKFLPTNDITVQSSLKSSIIKQEDPVPTKRPPNKNSALSHQHKHKPSFTNDRGGEKTERSTTSVVYQNSMDNRKLVPEENKERMSELQKFVKMRTPKRESEVFIEIFDKPKRNEHSMEAFGVQDVHEGQRNDQQANSLAEMFRKKMNQKTVEVDRRPKTLSQHPKAHESSKISAEDKLMSPRQEKERTKQDILELRKKMMKSTVREKKDNFVNEQASKNQSNMPMELMQRLAKGQKAQIDSKEMKKLSTKNYENLPEVKKKKEEEKKKQEYKERQAQVKKYAEEIEKKRKQITTKKQTLDN